MQVLLLNASYEPIRVITAERAVVLVLTGKAEIVSDSDHVFRSPSTEVRVPLVARLTTMAKVPRMQRVPFSRKMLSVRDKGLCQFNDCTARGTTIDHVIPRSQGGTTTWENCVMACGPCNFAKADKSLEKMGWTLKNEPIPVYGPMVLMARVGANADLPEWSQWLVAAG